MLSLRFGTETRHLLAHVWGSPRDKEAQPGAFSRHKSTIRGESIWVKAAREFTHGTRFELTLDHDGNPIPGIMSTCVAIEQLPKKEDGMEQCSVLFCSYGLETEPSRLEEKQAHCSVVSNYWRALFNPSTQHMPQSATKKTAMLPRTSPGHTGGI